MLLLIDIHHKPEFLYYKFSNSLNKCILSREKMS